MRTLLFAMLLLAACTTPKEPVRPPPPTSTDTVKPGAPTVVTNTQVATSSASVTLRFEGSGENVAVVASGIDGLTLSSPAEIVSGRSVKVGDELPINVTFQGTGHVVLTVQGTFNGAQRSRVHTVRIGEALKGDGSKVQVTSDGDAVKLMP